MRSGRIGRSRPSPAHPRMGGASRREQCPAGPGPARTGHSPDV